MDRTFHDPISDCKYIELRISPRNVALLILNDEEKGLYHFPGNHRRIKRTELPDGISMMRRNREEQTNVISVSPYALVKAETTNPPVASLANAPDPSLANPRRTSSGQLVSVLEEQNSPFQRGDSTDFVACHVTVQLATDFCKLVHPKKQAPTDCNSIEILVFALEKMDSMAPAELLWTIVQNADNLTPEYRQEINNTLHSKSYSMRWIFKETKLLLSRCARLQFTVLDGLLRMAALDCMFSGDTSWWMGERAAATAPEPPGDHVNKTPVRIYAPNIGWERNIPLNELDDKYILGCRDISFKIQGNLQLARAIRLSDALPHCAEMLAKSSEADEEQQPWTKQKPKYKDWISTKRKEVARLLQFSLPVGSPLDSCTEPHNKGWWERRLLGSTRFEPRLFLLSAEIVTHFAASPSSAANLRSLLEKHDDLRSVLQIGANSWNAENQSKACKTLFEYFIEPRNQLWKAILESNSKAKEFYTIDVASDCPWFQFLVEVNIGEGMISVVSKYGFGLSGSEQVKLTAIQLFDLVTKCIKDGIVTVRLPLLEKDDLMSRHEVRKHRVEYKNDDKLTDFAPSFRFSDQEGTVGLAKFVEVVFHVMTGNKGSLTNGEVDLHEKLLRCLIELQQQQGDENASGATSMTGKRKHSETKSTQDAGQTQQQLLQVQLQVR